MPTLVVGGLLGGRLVLRGLGPAGPAFAAPAPTRDHDLVADVRTRLLALDRFDGVFLCSPNEFEGRGADLVTVAFVWPDRWAATDEVDDPDGPEERRTLAFNVAIYVKDRDPARRYDRLDRLGQVVQNAITGKSLADASLIAFTRLRGGRYATLPPPYGAMQLQGEAVYLVPAYGGRGEAENYDLLDP